MMLSRILVALSLAVVLAIVGPSSATEIPWKPGDVDVQAVNEPLTPFILRVLTRQRLAASVSESVGTEAVNGRFRGRPDVVFREIVETYGLTWYYDGSVVHVTSLSENRSRLLALRPSQAVRVERVLRDMRILDPRYPLRVSSSEGYVFVSAPPRMVELVSEAVRLLSELPEVSEGVTRVFRLKHAWAADTRVSVGGVETEVAGVASIVGDIMGDAGRQSTLRQRQVPARQPGLRGSGLAAVGAPELSAAPMPPAAQGAQSLNGPASAAASAPPASGAAPGPGRGSAARASADESKPGVAVVVRAEPRLNAVIVRDLAERMPMYEELIASLDVPSSLIEVEATVIDVSADTSQTLGIDWRAHSSRVDVVSSPNNLAGRGGSPAVPNAANDLLNSGDPFSAGQGLIGTLLFGSQRAYFLARINALSQDGEANLVSRPRVLTLDNNEAVLQSTQEFYVRVQGKDAVDLYNISVGLLLRVTPTLIDEGGKRRFKLLVRIEDGSPTTTPQNGVDQIPLVSRNSIVTQAMISEGESLLIGGYVIDRAQKGEVGVPFLSRLPGVGLLFRQDSKSSRRIERMFMITPRLVTRETGSIE